MPERIPQSTTLRVPLQAYLSSDHVTPATGKTLAVTASKNGAAYANPSAGATNATEIASGSYYVDLSTTDTNTLGPLYVLATGSGVDNVVAVYNVVKATNAGFTALPDTAVTTNASLLTSGTGTAQLSVGSGLVTLAAVTHTGAVIPTVTTTTTATNLTNLPAIPANWLTATGIAAAALNGKGDWMVSYAQPAGFLAATFPGTVASPTNITAGVITTVTTLTNLPAAPTDWVTSAAVSAAAVTKVQAGLATPTNITAGTITTTTNLTNLPAAPTDWLTAAALKADAAAEIAGAVWTDTDGTHFTVALSPGAILFGFPAFDAGVAQAGSSTTVTLASGATGAAIGPNGLVTVWGPSVPTQSARVASYNTSTKVVTIEGSWLVAPTNTTNYAVDWSSEFRTTLNAVTHTGATVPAVTAVTGAVGSVAGNVGGDVAGKVLGGGASTITAVGAEAFLAPATNVLDAGTCQAGSTGTTVVLRAGSPLGAGIAGTGVVSIDAGTGQGQWRRVAAYNAGTQTATVPAWYTTPDNTSVYSVTSEDRVNADAQAVAGSAAAALGLSAMGQATFSGVVSSDSAATTTSFTMNTTGSPGLSTTSGFYSTPNSLVVFYSGADASKTSSCSNYVYSSAVGTFTLGQALPVAPSVGDKVFVISVR